jgi:hypothetical protein
MKRFALVGFPDGLANQDSGGFIRRFPPNRKTDKTLPLPKVLEIAYLMNHPQIQQRQETLLGVLGFALS